MRSSVGQARDIAKEPELIAGGTRKSKRDSTRKSKGDNHKHENATLGHCLGVYGKQQSSSSLHITGSMLSLSASPCPACLPGHGQCREARNLVVEGDSVYLPWGEIRGVGCLWGAATCHRVASCRCAAALNTAHSFNKQTVVPWQLCSVSLRKLDRYKKNRYVFFNSVTAYAKGLSQSVCRREAKHLGGHGHCS